MSTRPVGTHVTANKSSKRALKRSSQRNTDTLRVAKEIQEQQHAVQAAAKAAAAKRRRAEKRRARAANRQVRIVVDGSYCNLSGVGAWAVTRSGHPTLSCTGTAESSYHCELLALLEGLRSVPTGRVAHVTSDCLGVVDGFARVHDVTLLRKPTSARMVHSDTWELVLKEVQRLNNNVSVHWDRAHLTTSLTREADIAARALLRSTRVTQAA